MKKKKQQTLFDSSELEQWRKEWKGMPEFIQENAKPFKTIKVYLDNKKAVKKFAKLIGQKITDKTTNIWFPKLKPIEEREVGMLSHKNYVDKS